MFLTFIRREICDVLKELLTPTLPSDKYIINPKTTLLGHYSPKSLVIANKYKFYNVNQYNQQDVRAFAALLRKLDRCCELKFEQSEDGKVQARIRVIIV